MQEHIPVLLKEVLYFLDVKPGKRYVDATAGGGGHLEAILQAGGEVLGIDQDPQSLKIAERRLSAYPNAFRLIMGNFSNLYTLVSEAGWQSVDGVLFDLGFASFQVEDPTRGLSFRKKGPLDMRLDPNLGVTGADLINSLPENELSRLFSEVGQEKQAFQIARAIVAQRRQKPFQETAELASLVEQVYRNFNISWQEIHPATKVFLALRIAVNTELDNLQQGLSQAGRLLGKRGRLVVISFHSGEDRIVKAHLREQQRLEKMNILTKKPVVPSFAEVRDNPRARSAKLRAGEKIK